ncbi:MAG: hypothetical protein METHAR1v1_470011 [Methanothrix sp.]|jgi:hypothetical protein|nr:MAG: hypothetical protein METHAR1v1_470011 [Methanothrix sp.]
MPQNYISEYLKLSKTKAARSLHKIDSYKGKLVRGMGISHAFTSKMMPHASQIGYILNHCSSCKVEFIIGKAIRD